MRTWLFGAGWIPLGARRRFDMRNPPGNRRSKFTAKIGFRIGQGLGRGRIRSAPLGKSANLKQTSGLLAAFRPLFFAQRLQSSKPCRKRARPAFRSCRIIVHACERGSRERHISRGGRVRTGASALAGRQWRCGCRKIRNVSRETSGGVLFAYPWRARAGPPLRSRGI